MSRQHWLASFLIAYHLVALSVAAVPPPQSLAEATTVRSFGEADFVTASLDGLAQGLASVEPSLFNALQPIARLTRPYIQAGVGTQQWNMFSSPFKEDNYVRIDYFLSVDRDPRRSRHFRELILPADREQHVRLARRYRDKAIFNAYEAFANEMARLRNSPASTPDTMEADRLLRAFEPVTRYFRSRLKPHLAPGERVVRTELWYGAAPTPPRGHVIAADVAEARLKAIEPFHDGPALVASSAPGIRSPGTTEQEVDLIWTLLYVDKP